MALSATCKPNTFARIAWIAFRRRCHRILSVGYEGALHRIRTGPSEETDITGFICESINNWFRNNPEESFAFYVKDDPPVNEGGKTGKRRPRTDIVIGYAAGTRPEWVFECKRLHSKGASIGKYTGPDGLGCFTTGRYASQFPEAAMVGYFQTDTSEGWRGKIQRSIRKRSEALTVKDVQDSIDMPEAFALEWTSTHSRENLGQIEVFHILLDCCQPKKRRRAPAKGRRTTRKRTSRRS